MAWHSSISNRLWRRRSVPFLEPVGVESVLPPDAGVAPAPLLIFLNSANQSDWFFSESPAIHSLRPFNLSLNGGRVNIVRQKARAGHGERQEDVADERDQEDG